MRGFNKINEDPEEGLLVGGVDSPKKRAKVNRLIVDIVGPTPSYSTKTD